MNDPIAWLVESGEGGFVTLSPEVYRAKGWKVTALVAAPPEGQESPELAECRDSLHALIAEGDADAGRIRQAFGITPDGRSLTAQLLSIAPPEGAPGYADLVKALRETNEMANAYAEIAAGMKWDAASGDARALVIANDDLLSRIPKEASA